jgi:DNA-binding MarR family transcriptional regulator
MPSLSNRVHRADQIATQIWTSEAESCGLPWLTARQADILVAVSEVAKGTIATQTYVTEMTGIDRSTTAEIVARLVENGMLDRKRHKTDARVWSLSLTTQAKRLLPKIVSIETAVARKLRARVSGIDALSIVPEQEIAEAA